LNISFGMSNGSDFFIPQKAWFHRLFLFSFIYGQKGVEMLKVEKHATKTKKPRVLNPLSKFTQNFSS